MASFAVLGTSYRKVIRKGVSVFDCRLLLPDISVVLVLFLAGTVLIVRTAFHQKHRIICRFGNLQQTNTLPSPVQTDVLVANGTVDLIATSTGAVAAYCTSFSHAGYGSSGAASKHVSENRTPFALNWFLSLTLFCAVEPSYPGLLSTATSRCGVAVLQGPHRLTAARSEIFLLAKRYWKL